MKLRDWQDLIDNLSTYKQTEGEGIDGGAVGRGFATTQSYDFRPFY